MGVYNPSNPHILGQEWVPIREPDLTMARYDSPIEWGHRFTLETSRAINRGFFFIKEYPEDFVLWQPWTMAIYPAGEEALTGPVQRLVIPASTNSSLTNTSGQQAQLFNCGTVAQAVQDPSADSFLQMAPQNNGNWNVKIYFNTTSYASVLTGKRILGLNILYAGSYSATTTDPLTLNNLKVSLRTNDMVTGSTNTIVYPIMDLNYYRPSVINRVALGDVNELWGVTTNLGNTVDLMPWDAGQLARFNDTGTQGIFVQFLPNVIFSQSTGEAWDLNYIALEVIFCEEQRVAVGTKEIGPSGAGHYQAPPSAPGANFHDFWFQMNANQILMHKVTSNWGDPNPVLPPGEYTVTITRANVGQKSIQTQFPIPSPTVQAATQFYALPNHKGIKITHPTPIDTTILNKTFVVSETNTLPQLSLFISGGVGGNNGSVLPEMHVYGQQTAAQVNSAQSPTSTVIDTLSTGGFASYKYIRFYARKWDWTTSPLIITGSASLSGSGNQLIWTPWEHDQLPEIVDGWKEVTLTYPTAITLGGSAFPNLQFTNAGQPGSEWQILGASSLALSGRPDFTGQLYPLPFRGNAANYGGQSQFEAWNYQGSFEPAVGTTSNDVSSDMTFLFAQQLTAPTLTLTNQSQPLSGIGTVCGVSPAGVPTSLSYNKLSWFGAVGNNIAADDFTRVRAKGTGIGPAYNLLVGTTTFWGVDGSQAFEDGDLAGSQNIFTFNGVTLTDSDAQATFTPNISPVFQSTNLARFSLYARVSNASNYYFVTIEWSASGPLLNIQSRVAGVNNNLGSRPSVPVNVPLINNSKYKIRFQVQSYTFRAKVWLASDDEPDWQISWTDPNQSFASGTSGFGQWIIGTTTTNQTWWDNFHAAPFNLVGSSYELQRQGLSTTWETILNTKNLATVTFYDYEARVGVATSYRLRINDQYLFNGAFSGTVTGTIAAPGIAGGSITPSGQHVLLLTTNELQDGSGNLAYSSAWESSVTEPFTFNEAGQVQLQLMYGKDFYTAFRPLERGGVRFQRNVLVNAAAISVPTLPGFKSLRDLAWDQVSYVCVRDEQGNRWFATVLVPNGNVSNNRQLYLASLDIVEVTSTPSQVST